MHLRLSVACVAGVERGREQGIGRKGKRGGGFLPPPSPSPFCACHAGQRSVMIYLPNPQLKFRPEFENSGKNIFIIRKVQNMGPKMDESAMAVLACVVWRFCRAGRTSSQAARKIKTACPDSWPFQLPPPSTHFDILLTTCLVSVFPANQK